MRKSHRKVQKRLVIGPCFLIYCVTISYIFGNSFFLGFCFSDDRNAPDETGLEGKNPTWLKDVNVCLLRFYVISISHFESRNNMYEYTSLVSHHKTKTITLPACKNSTGFSLRNVLFVPGLTYQANLKTYFRFYIVLCSRFNMCQCS